MPYKIILKLHELNWWSSESDETQRIQKTVLKVKWRHLERSISKGFK